jgi:hypothetical protein
MKLGILSGFLLLVFRPSDQIFSSAPYSETPPVCGHPLVSETKFDTHAKLQAKLYIFIL